MKIAVGFTCVVAMAVLLEGVIGLSDQQLSNENHISDIGARNTPYQENPMERRRGKSLCRRRLGGRCVRRRKRCPGRLPIQSSPGSPYCSKFHRCCHKVEPPVISTTPAPPECSSPWFRVGDQCFFALTTEGSYDSWGSPWSEARDYCGDLTSGADLAQPKDLQALKDGMEADGRILSAKYWVGGSYLATEGIWRWTNGSDVVTGWEPGYPYIGDADDCLVVEPGLGDNSLIGVNSLEYGSGYLNCATTMWFICERY